MIGMVSEKRLGMFWIGEFGGFPPFFSSGCKGVVDDASKVGGRGFRGYGIFRYKRMPATDEKIYGLLL